MNEDLGSWYSARDGLVDALESELMGPVEPLPLDEAPLNRIVVGVLNPQSAQEMGGDRPGIGRDTDDYRQGMDEDAAMDSQAGPGTLEEADTESAVALSRSKRPSAMGLTFTVAQKNTATVSVSVDARRYELRPDERWHAIDVAVDDSLSITVGRSGRFEEFIGAENLRIVWLVRPATDGLVRITVSLANTSTVPKGERRDAFCWFRPRLVVRTESGSFVDRRRDRKSPSSDRDVRSNDFLYRNEPALAVGHGCAVTWDEQMDVTELRTTFLPSHDVRLARPSGGDSDDPFGTYELDMQMLASSSDTSQLQEMASAYERWIAAQRADAVNLSDPHRRTALDHMDLADACVRRIREGIAVLEDPTDVHASLAFRLMNEAMVEQRRAQDAARGVLPRAQRWRPFQIAFILMNLPALAAESHPDRSVVDLLWFPTGGGKTEAYLGCIGFVILNRRLQRADDGGVSAIMRYTLRLLTRQQFERAAGLICALELIRRRELPDAVEISLGLWVGDKASPNKVEDAKRILSRIASGEQPEGSTPVQLLRCPWCGASMDHRNYMVIDNQRLHISCIESQCEFVDGLPLFVTDDDVYRVRPSLIIGTVDKFAMMTWKEEVGELLSVSGPNSRPDLIVQDELHLISGPLGTMVGLYEAALDLACTGADRPKVLASTATIRRAEQQVKAVFDRTSVQFPPPGLHHSDNYFAVEASPEDKGTRRYVGVLSPGTSQATLLVRIYSTLLQRISDSDLPDYVRDDYWTLLGYFNSLRVLGSTYLQVLDDVPDRIGVLAARDGKTPRSISQEPVELTSRVDQTRIPRAMARLETSYPAPGSPDMVLATNMISVGLDIDRLGLMVVAGQPQSTSEYIQSTSRVGRRNPGLVVVALNGQRSRDTSHYESFIPFHRALYREVDATTATPFASRARDRGAHGMLVAAIRMLVPQLRADGAAARVGKHKSVTARIVDALAERARRVAPEEHSAFREQLSSLIDTWEESAETGLVDHFGKLRHPSSSKSIDGHPLVTSPGGEYSKVSSYPVEAPPWPTLTSMRDVDAETNLYVKYLKESDK